MMETPDSFNEARNTADSYRTAARDARQQLTETAHQHADELKAQAAAGMEAARLRGRELSAEAETLVRERPWVALGVAALAGMAIAKLLS